MYSLQPPDRKIELKQQIFVIGAISCGALGCLFALVGAASAEWVTGDDGVRVGLIFACNGDCSAFAAKGSIVASKLFTVLAFFCAVVAVTILLVYYFKYFREGVKHRSLPFIAATFYLSAAGLDIVSAVIFVARGKSEAEISLKCSLTIGYSFILTVVGAVFLAIAGIWSLIHRCGLKS